jgi:hypothetical protein
MPLFAAVQEQLCGEYKAVFAYRNGGTNRYTTAALWNRILLQELIVA